LTTLCLRLLKGLHLAWLTHLGKLHRPQIALELLQVPHGRLRPLQLLGRHVVGVGDACSLRNLL